MQSSAKISFFQNVIGHEEQCRQLERMHATNTTPHAFVFSGPSGIGKRTIAHQFAALLLASSSNSSQVPSQEELKKLVDSGNHPDLHFLFQEQGAKEISVESVRKLCSSLQLKPYYNRGAVAVIDSAHRMTVQACNALLTTLEEPGEAKYLILITESAHRLLDTIVSRCQVIHFNELSKNNTNILLKKLFDKMLNQEDIDNLSAITDGSLAPLMLDFFVDPRTLQFTDPGRLKEHLTTLNSQAKKVQTELETLLSKDSPNFGYGVKLAAELDDAMEDYKILWHVMRLTLRNKMKTAPKNEKKRYAELLLKALEVETNIDERNFNPQLQLSSLFLETQ